MKTLLSILTLAGLLATTSLSSAAEAEKTAVPKLAIKVTSFTDDVKKLDTQLTLTDEQKAGIQTARGERDNELAQWDDRNEKAIASLHEKATKASGKPGPLKHAQDELAALMAARERIVANYEKKMFELLTPEQRAKYNAPLLSTEVQQEFKALKLTTEQIDQITALCQDPASKMTEPMQPKKPPASVKVLIGEVIPTVLTPEQRKAYSDSKAPAKGKRLPATPKKTA
jgi:Spy/CpxP family protein refolding chaperone